jgi:hypothetical protein
VLGHRNLLLMVDIVNALQDSTTRHAERGELQRDWIVSSAECSHRAGEALAKAAEVLADQPLADVQTTSWRGPGPRWGKDGPA